MISETTSPGRSLQASLLMCSRKRAERRIPWLELHAGSAEARETRTSKSGPHEKFSGHWLAPESNMDSRAGEVLVGGGIIALLVFRCYNPILHSLRAKSPSPGDASVLTAHRVTATPLGRRGGVAWPWMQKWVFFYPKYVVCVLVT